MDENRARDEELLIDFMLGETDPPEAEAVRQRLAADPAFRKLRGDLANTVEALRLLPEAPAPDGLVDSTLDRIRRQRRTDELLAREHPSHRVLAPTFSLRELGALAAAAVVLAVVFVPAFMASRQRALQSQCAAHVGQIGYAVRAYATANEGFLPGVEGEQQRWLPGPGAPAVSNSRGLFKLVALRYASPVSFQCPAVAGGSFVVRAGMTDFPKADFVNYSYHHMIGPAKLRLNDPALEAVGEEKPILADNTPLFENGQFLRDRLDAPAGQNHAGRGQNVLHLKGNVAWREGPAVGVHQDNIFLAGNITDYTGTEQPTGPEDSFLLPAYTPGAAPP